MMLLWIAWLCAKPEPMGYFAHLAGANVSLYSGPGKSYPVKFILSHKRYPLRVIAVFDVWRKVVDYEKTEGWVHQSCLSRAGQFGILLQNTQLYKEAQLSSASHVNIEAGCIVKLLRYNSEWCFVQATYQGENKATSKVYKGWVPRANLWGLTPLL